MRHLSPPPGNPVIRMLAGAVASVVGVLAVIGSFLLGLAFISVVIGVALVLGLVIWLRAWWVTRKAGGVERQPPGHSKTRGDTIETEYTVVSRRRDRD